MSFGPDSVTTNVIGDKAVKEQCSPEAQDKRECQPERKCQPERECQPERASEGPASGAG